jgi:hypothetical protein
MGSSSRRKRVGMKSYHAFRYYEAGNGFGEIVISYA